MYNVRNFTVFYYQMCYKKDKNSKEIKIPASVHQLTIQVCVFVYLYVMKKVRNCTSLSSTYNVCGIPCVGIVRIIDKIIKKWNLMSSLFVKKHERLKENKRWLSADSSWVVSLISIPCYKLLCQELNVHVSSYRVCLMVFICSVSTLQYLSFFHLSMESNLHLFWFPITILKASDKFNKFVSLSHPIKSKSKLKPIVARNNGRSTDNVWSDLGVDRSTFCLAGYVARSHSIVLKMK